MAESAAEEESAVSARSAEKSASWSRCFISRIRFGLRWLNPGSFGALAAWLKLRPFEAPELVRDQIGDGGGDAAVVIGQRHAPTPGAELGAGIPHDNRMAGELKHFDVVVVITDGHDLFATVAAVGGPAAESVTFGAAGIEDVDHREIALGIFGAEDSDAVAHAGGLEGAQGLGHAVHGAAEHGLDGIGDEGLLEGDDEVDVLHIFFEPAADADIQGFEVLENDGAFALLVEGKNGVAAEILHAGDQFAAKLARHEVAVKSLAGEGASDGTVGADQPEIETKLSGDGQGKAVAASGDENDLNAGGVSAAESFEVIRGDLKLGIEESAIDIGGEKADGAGLRASGFRRR